MSDHGYGHASRTIAVIRKLSRLNASVKISVKAAMPYDFLKDSLPDASVHKAKNDVGVVCDEKTLKVDVASTQEEVSRWVRAKSDSLRKEIDFCRETGAELIVSDIPPFPFDVATRLGLPSVAMSNFNWYWVYSRLFAEEPMLEDLMASYRQCSLALLLPFHKGMELFKRTLEIPLVVRESDEPRPKLRARLGLKEGETAVFATLGKSIRGTEAKIGDTELGERKVRIITTLLGARSNRFIRVSPAYNEFQNIVAASDVVAAKAGYSTVSECIASNVPMVLTYRPGFAEDEVIVEEVERLRIAKIVQPAEFLSLDWLESLDDVLAMRRNYRELPSLLRPTGAQVAAEKILEFL